MDCMQHSLLPQTIPRPKTKRLHRLPPIPRPLVPAHPPLGHIALRRAEVPVRVVRRVLGHVHARAAGDVMAGYTIAGGRHDARKARRHGRIHAQGFLQAGEHVVEAVDLVQRDLVQAVEAGADVVHEARVRVRVGQQEVRDAGEDGCCSLRAGAEEEDGVGVHFVAGDGLGLAFLGFGDVGEEVRAVGALVQASGDFVVREVEEGDAGGVDVGRGGEERAELVPVGEEGVLDARGEQADGFDAAEHELDPLVFFAVAQAVQRLAEGEVADDVEGGVVVPAHDVDGLGLGGVFAQAVDEEVDVLLDQGFLLAECFVAEGVGEVAAHPGMVGFVGGEERPDAVDGFGEPGRVLEVGSGVLVLACAEPVDVGPCCLAGNKGYFIRRNSYCVTVLVV